MSNNEPTAQEKKEIDEAFNKLNEEIFKMKNEESGFNMPPGEHVEEITEIFDSNPEVRQDLENQNFLTISDSQAERFSSETEAANQKNKVTDYSK